MARAASQFLERSLAHPLGQQRLDLAAASGSVSWLVTFQIRPLPVLSQPLTQSRDVHRAVGAEVDVGGQDGPDELRGESTSSNEAPLGLLANERIPLLPAPPRKSARKKWSRYLAGRPVPGSWTRPEGPSEMLMIGGTM